MKKIFCAFIAILLLSGCSGVSQADYDAVVKERDELRTQLEQKSKEIPSIQNDAAWKPGDSQSSTESSNDAFDVQQIIAKLETKEYTWKSYSNYCVALVVKNNSEYEMDLSADIQFFDANGKVIGAKEDSENAIAPNSETIFIFINDAPFSKFTYEYTPSQNKYYSCVSQNISYETSITDKKVIVTATNNGNVPVKFAECTAIFISGENAVGSDYGYCTDDDSELKPGKSKSIELRCYELFDDVKIIFSGRADK